VKVLRIGYLGVRTPHVEETTSFFRDVLGLEAVGEGETVTFTRLPTHRRDLLEVYSPEHDDERMIPNGVDFMVAFVVDDLERALAEVRAAGVELVGEVVWAAQAFGDPAHDGFGWFFVRAPDGRVYAIVQAERVI
jgi:catechol 2,3-dioxygenase-like lactoylglutathione lyase family enzyme